MTPVAATPPSSRGCGTGCLLPRAPMTPAIRSRPFPATSSLSGATSRVQLPTLRSPTRSRRASSRRGGTAPRAGSGPLPPPHPIWSTARWRRSRPAWMQPRSESRILHTPPASNSTRAPRRSPMHTHRSQAARLLVLTALLSLALGSIAAHPIAGHADPDPTSPIYIELEQDLLLTCQDGAATIPISLQVREYFGTKTDHLDHIGSHGCTYLSDGQGLRKLPGSWAPTRGGELDNNSPTQTISQTVTDGLSRAPSSASRSG